MFCRTARLAPVALLLFIPFAAFTPLPAQQASAQQASPEPPSTTPQPVTLLVPNAPGRLLIAASPGWVVSSIALEDGTSPMVTLSQSETALTASYSLFPSHAAPATPSSCRDEALAALLAQLSSNVKLRDRRDAVRSSPGPDATPLATTSVVLVSTAPVETLPAWQNIGQAASEPVTQPAGQPAGPMADQSEFLAFAAGTGVCAEVHISHAPAATFDDKMLAEPLALFHFDPTYAPTSDDFATLGVLFADQVNDHIAAALYYQRALQLLPVNDDPALLATRRRYNDEVFQAYLLAQDRDRARATEEAALTTDPNYALYYYQLGCLDAEDGNAANARKHLQQAFDHRAGLPAGEELPAPGNDPSFQKLMKDKSFWKFVERIH